MGQGVCLSLLQPPDETAPDYFPTLGVSTRFLDELLTTHFGNTETNSNRQPFIISEVCEKLVKPFTTMQDVSM